MLDVVVPYVITLHPTVSQVLRQYERIGRIRLCLVELHDDDAYRRLLKARWRFGKPFAIVEHDIIPWPGALEELFDCVGAWCTYSYQPYGVQHAFGCAKFTPALMDRLPDIWNEPRHWSTLDSALYVAARAIGELPHPHRPPVIHLKACSEALDSSCS